MELLNWLAELSKTASPAENRLIDLLQRALFAADPAAMEVSLDPPQLAIWQEILYYILVNF